MSLFGEYMAETLNRKIIETDKGFITYIFGDEDCYIEDLFVQEEFRERGIGKEFADAVRAEAKALGKRSLTTTVNLRINNPTRSMQIVLSYGFKITGAQPGVIFLGMEV